MKPEIQKLEDSIKRIHRVAFTPKFKDSFQTNLSKSAFLALSLKVIEKIEWELVFYNESSIEAKRKNDWGNYTEGISIQYEFGTVKIQSTSLGNEMWDFGKNSKRVKLFQLVLEEMQNSLSKEEIGEIESEQKKLDNWEEYVVPEALPKPAQLKKPNLYIPLIVTVIASIALGYILAQCISNGFYFIGLFDAAIGFALGFVLTQTLSFANYTNFKNLRLILIASVIVSFVACQLFIYQINLSAHAVSDIDFISFMKLRLEAGLTIKSLNTGWIGLLLSWGVFLFFGYFIGLLKLTAGIVSYQLNRIPKEVLDFAMYLVVKDKSEEQMRKELSHYGWTNPEDQDYVLEAVGAVGDAQEMRRGKTPRIINQTKITCN